MELMERIRSIGLVPVVAFDSPSQAIPAARALREGGIDAIEVTMRTEAGLASIGIVRRAFPDMAVGAGTVTTLERAKACVGAGASFIVLPGFVEDVAEWCVANGVPVMPGCVTPAEILRALALGLTVLKFFPADVYGGAKALRALHGPFGPLGVSYVPTGGVDLKSLPEYAALPYVAAVGGGWLCPAKALKAGDYAAITKAARESVDALLGFEAGLGQIGPGCGAGGGPGVTLRTNNMERAAYHLARKGFAIDEATAERGMDGKLAAATFRDGPSPGGFALRVSQK
jgi:2-dehydro-3-deoxyphosphogluconate aldolase/(4S)-4-hydroxy-2-oxoglutarate aldolase